MATAPKIDLTKEDDGLGSPEVVERFREKFFKVNGPQADQYSREALDWFRREVTKNLNPKAQQVLESRKYKRKGDNPGLIGRLYLFEYEAVEAGDEETGVYDRFPLVFFFNVITTAGGNRVLYGINMHYLAPAIRMRVYNALLQLKTQKTMNAKQKLRMSWKVLKTVANNQAMEKAVHAYRVDRLKTALVEIRPADWHVLVFLQVQRWVKVGGDGLTQSGLRKQMVKRGTIKPRKK